MTRYRREFGRWVNQLAGGFGQAELTGAGDKADANVRRANKTWVILLILAIIVSGLVTFFLKAGLSSQVIIAAIWGPFIGLTLLFFLPQKLLITMIGGTIGALLSNLSDIVNIFRNLMATAAALTSALNGFLADEVTIYKLPILLFIVLFFACCLPAYQGHDN